DNVRRLICHDFATAARRVGNPRRAVPFGSGALRLPLALLGKVGLSVDGRLTFAPIRAALQDVTVRRALWHSVETAGWSGLFALLIGAALALALGLTDVRAKGAIVFALILPMMIPQHVTAIAWIQATGPGSLILKALGLAPPVGTTNPLYSRDGVILLLTIHHAPLVLLVLLSALRRLPRELVDAARISGARPSRVLLSILLPVSAPSLIAAYALAVVSTLGNFGIPALLGIPGRYLTMPVLIWRRLSAFGPSMLADVAVLSALLGILAIAAVMAQMALQRRVGARLPGRFQKPITLQLGPARPLIETAIALYVVLTVVVPLTALLSTSLVPTYGVALNAQTATLSNYAEVLFHQQATLRAFVNSGLAAGGAAVTLAAVAMLLSIFLTRRPSGLPRVLVSTIVTLGEITYAVPGIVISIAFILAFLRPLPILHLSLYNTLTIIFLAYVTAFLSIAIKPVAAAAAQIDDSLDAAGRVSGADFVQRFRRILMPLIAPSAASGAILVFLTAYNEVTVSSLLWSTGTETVGTTIFNYEDGGASTLAAAMAMLTVVVTVVGMALVTSVARRLPRGVIPWML
ncbi:MAG: iron ABC transporter permease, partial [Paracoccaceae bacterium]|nr:iron ABC transporter permease [Paracoccaceae bacterium]